MRIESLSQHNQHEWQGFIGSLDDSSVFLTLEWKGLIESVFSYPAYYFLLKEKDRVIGVAPFFLVCSFIFGNRLISVPFSDKGGIFFDFECSFQQRNEALSGVIEALKPVIKEFKVKYIEIRGSFFDGFVLQNAYCISRQPYIDFVFDLKRSWQVITGGFAAGLKWRLRKSQDVGFQVKRLAGQEALKSIYDIYIRDISKFGTPLLPAGYFTQEWDRLRPSSLFDVFVLEHKQRIVAAITLLIGKRSVQGELIMSDRSFDKLSPKSYLFFETMRWAKENNYRTYHLGRTRSGTGVYEHKRRWGGLEIPINYFYVVFDRKSNIEMDYEQGCFDIPMMVMKRLPLWAHKLIGPVIRQHMGK